MSVVALQIREGYCLLAGDGVCTDPDTGHVAGYLSKITAMPDLDCAFAITGIGGFNYAIQWNMPRWVSNFDDFVEALPSLVHRTHLQMRLDKMIRGTDDRVNVMAAGWSTREERFKAVRVVSYEKGSTNLETGQAETLKPFVAYEFASGGLWMSAAPTPKNMELFGLSEPIEGESDLDTMTRAICAARASSGMVSDEGREYRYNAGGFVQLAMVQRGSVQTWVPHRWPEDEVDEPIRPELGAPLPDHLPLVEAT
jgi:hypothetical protein